MVFLINFPVPTPFNRIGWLKENIDKLLRLVWLCFIRLIFLSYWSNAFSITVYLINRIPTFVLDFVSPWQKLYLKNPSLQALKVFGCSCFPFLKPCYSHKFDPKSKLCIFELSTSFRRLYHFGGLHWENLYFPSLHFS